MMNFFTKRLRDEDRGFTLIELMVVVLIIAILIAIAIPTFLGARKRAQDRAAQSSAKVALTAAKTVFTDNESYANATHTVLAESEPSYTFVAATVGSTDANTVSVNPVDANTFRAAVYSKSGLCFHIKDVSGPQTAAGLGTTYARDDVADDTAACTASAAVTFTDTGWQ